MTIKQIHDRINFIRDQEIGGYNTPEEIDISLDMGSMWCFNDYAAMYAMNQTAREALAPFIYQGDFTTNSSGVINLTSLVATDNYFMKLLSIDVVVNDTEAPAYVQSGNRYYPVEISNEDEYANKVNSQLNAPGATNPVVLKLSQTEYRFYPAQVHAGKVRALRRPAKPVFGYSESGRVVTYDSVTSTQLEWNDMFVNKVIAKALHFLGVNLDDDKLATYGLNWPKENV